MNNEQADFHLQAIQQRIAALQSEDREAWQNINAALEELHSIYEQMQTNLQDAEGAKQRLLQQNQQIAAGYYHYQNLFQSSPIAYLVTNSQGLILEANQASAQLLNVPAGELVRKSLVGYIAEDEQSTFQNNLNQLSQNYGVQIWQMTLCPADRAPLTVELHLDIVQGNSGLIEGLRIGIFNISQSQQRVTHLIQQQFQTTRQTEGARLMTQLPQSLDGLRVLIVDDEADAREFITAVLEAHGVQVQAVPNAAAALAALEQFRPDVLLSDIRMPEGDGYSLIQQIRALEAAQGNHIPAGAITAYLDEDRTKALSSGYEDYLHKLAHPTEWIEMIARLARQGQAL